MKRLFMFAAVSMLVLAACSGMPNDVTGWKAVFDSVPVMFVCMLIGLLAYGLAQTRGISFSPTMGLWDYFTYIREAAIGVIVCLGAFVAALLADQMTAVGAFTLGMAGGVASDLGRGGRALDMAKAVVSDARKNAE